MNPEKKKPDATPDLARVLVGISHNIQQVRRKILECAQTDQKVLILGETGTGKEIIATEIHQRSACAGRLMETANVPDYSPNLIEAALFGHSRGAFTGATEASQGLFASADGTTLFLDEIGDMPKDLQVKLLGVVDRRQFRRVGDGKVSKSDFRLISATNKPIEEEAKKGKWPYLKRDLFGRLRKKVIRVKPLKERREDILPLMSHFLASRGINFDKLYMWWTSIHDLLFHSWPTNVRELQDICDNCEVGSPQPGDKDLAGRRLLWIDTDDIPDSSFDSDKLNLPPAIVPDGDSWGFELVSLKKVDEAIREALERREPWRDSEPVVNAVLIALAKRLVCLQKYEKMREKYLREKEVRAEKAEGPAGETGGIPSRSRSLLSTLTGSPDLSDYFSRSKTKSSGEVQDDAIRTLVKEGVKLPDLTTRFVDEFLRSNPVTGKTGQKLSSRAKQLGIDAKTLRKHLGRIKLATISLEGLLPPKPKGGQKTKSPDEQKRSREP